MILHTVSPPWNAPLTQSEYSLTLYFLAFTALAFFAAFLRAIIKRSEIGARYRDVTVARTGIVGVTLVAYLFLVASFLSGYTLKDGIYLPNPTAFLAFTPRYIEWSIAVPLLCAELLVVCTLVGETARRTRSLAMGGAFLMIFTGFIGAVVIDNGQDLTALIVWGAISTVFWIITTVVLIRAVKHSLPNLTPESARLLRQATALLLSCWFVYPLVYLIPIFFSGGDWATAIQIVLCITDLVVKIGFGTLLWRVAKLRTAEDVRAGNDMHPESIWISSVKQSDAGLPVEVHLAEGAAIHARRVRPPTGTAVASATTNEEYID